MLARRLTLTGDYTDPDWTNPANPIPDNVRAIKLVDDTLEIALQGKASNADDAEPVDVGDLLVDAYLVTKIGDGYVRGPSISDLVGGGNPISGKMLLRFPDVARGTTVYLALALTAVTVAVAATGTATVTSPGGANLVGGEVLERGDGAQFTVDGATVLPAATPTSVAVTASVAGTAGNTPTATVLTFNPVILGVNAAAPVEAPGILGGIDGLTVVDAVVVSGGRVL